MDGSSPIRRRLPPRRCAPRWFWLLTNVATNGDRARAQGCTLHAVATSYGAIAASQRSSAEEDSGFSFVGCRLTGSGMLYLGRAWGRYARVVYSYCDLGGIVVPQGWSDWGDQSRTK
jgi:pectinesterase